METVMARLYQMWFFCALGIMFGGCSSAPQPLLAHAEDVLQLKMKGADDHELLAWVKDPVRTFNLMEPDFESLARAGIGGDVLGELRSRTEEYRRSLRAGGEKHDYADKLKQLHGGGHQH